MSLSLSIIPRSLRWRLTLWHALVLGIVLGGFVIALYVLFARNLEGEMDRALLERAQQVNSAVRLAGFSGDELQVQIPPPDTFASADTFVQIIAPSGAILGSSANLDGAALPVDAQYLHSLQGSDGRYDVVVVQSARLRLYTAPLRLANQTVAYLQVARSMDRIDVALNQLRLLGGLGLIVALALSSTVVWLITRRSMRPLESVIETAEGIESSGDLGRRVAAPSTQDEVGRLATTFNAMLYRLDASARALQAAYERIGQALEAQRRFVADASHELRTPLTTIRSNASLLRDYPDVTEDDRRSALGQIDEEAERMSRLVHSLLTLARADAGLPFVLEPMPLAPLVEDVTDQIKAISQGQLTITSSLDYDAEVNGNGDALRQLLLILLDNAVKYTPSGGRIEVSLQREDDRVCITVADTGAGISAEAQPHIFDRFFRADSTRGTGGTGLGLSIAKWIVEQHGGSIAVSSKLGEGSTFTVTLPNAGPPSAQAED